MNQQKFFDTAKVYDFSDAIDYQHGAVVSKQVMKNEEGNVTLFAFDAGQGLSEHTAPFDALVQVIEGKATITIGGINHELTAGQSIIMPANVPHALYAEKAFKMLLTMIKA
ncbi:MAG: cupin domain-containing protein [Bacteroidia bacterium]|jgi:quercetin dioxygenase-like cupin family protein|nr:cupin domain-containing protein [Bacteroidia bacterium]